MPINNKPAAEAFLKLFDLNIPIERLEADLNRKHHVCNPLNNIVYIAKVMDNDRQRELFSTSPSIELMQAAYAQGIRFVYGNNGSNDVINMMRGNEQLGSVPAYAAMLNEPLRLFGEELEKVMFGNQAAKQRYNVKTLGEHFLNELSIKLSQEMRRSQDEKEIGFGRLNDCCIVAFAVKRDLHLATFNRDVAEGILKNLLKQAMQAAGYRSEQLEIDVNATLDSSSTYPIHRIADRVYMMNKRTIYVRAILEDETPEALHQIDLGRVLSNFRQLVASVPQDQLNLTPDRDDLKSKLSFFKKFQRTEGGLLEEGDVSKKSMQNILDRLNTM